MQHTPTYPPVSAIALTTSSGLHRMCWLTAAAAVWLATIGRPDAFAASRLVRQPEWATSTITPARFISAMAARPRSLTPPSAASPHPSPSMFRRL